MLPAGSAISLLSAFAAAVAAIGLLTEPAKADPRWCAVSHQRAGYCSFTTIEQCHAAVSGSGGFCMWEAPIGHRQPTRASIEAARHNAAIARPAAHGRIARIASAVACPLLHFAVLLLPQKGRQT